MAKKVTSDYHKKKAINKHNNNYIDKNKKLKIIFNNITNYFKSNTYMFSPIISASSLPNSLGVEPMILMKKTKKNWLEDYLKCDSYMYAPIFQQTISLSNDQIKGSQSQERVNMSSIHSEMEQKTSVDTTRLIDEITLTTPLKQVVNHVHMEQETNVKRILHQDPASSFVQAKKRKVQLQKEPSKIVAK